MIVIDASTVVEIVLRRVASEQLRARLQGQSLHAPYVVEVEALQAIRSAMRRGDVSDDGAALARSNLESMPLILYPHRPLMDRIWALRHTHTAYDASYVALAELLPAPLVTCDARLARSNGHDAEIELFAPPG